MTRLLTTINDALFSKGTANKTVLHVTGSMTNNDDDDDTDDEAIEDDSTSPLPIDPTPTTQTTSPSTTILPTEARLKQKQRLKEMKEQGLKPKKKTKVIEHGDDDCGDDLSGLGKDITLYGLDTIPETIEDNNDEDCFITIPTNIRTKETWRSPNTLGRR